MWNKSDTIGEEVASRTNSVACQQYKLQAYYSTSEKRLLTPEYLRKRFSKAQEFKCPQESVEILCFRPLLRRTKNRRGEISLAVVSLESVDIFIRQNKNFQSSRKDKKFIK